MFIQIAIDGPGGVGKSTLAKALAKRFNLVYVNTGLIFRGLAWYLEKHSGEIEEELTKIAKYKTLEFKNNNWFLKGELIDTKEFETKLITDKACQIAKLKSVRDYVLGIERMIADENNVIMDGRDIGTSVFPNAIVKIFLTASPEIRAKRRFEELKYKKMLKGRSEEDVLREIIKRDEEDVLREVSPLVKAEDAIDVDGSREFDEVLIKVVRIIESKLSGFSLTP